MSEWKNKFHCGVKAFREGNMTLAIDLFTEAIEQGADGHAPLDSRAAAYERQGKYKEALIDSRSVIDQFPDLPHGFSRSARLLTYLGEHERAVALATKALVRSKPNDSRAAAIAQAILDKALLAQHDYLQDCKKKECHITKLPFELLATVFEMLVFEQRVSPVRLSHVCRHWKNVVFDVPGLWRRLELNGRTARHEQKTKFWTDHSQGKIRELYTESCKHLEACLTRMGDKTVAGLETIQFNVADTGADIPEHFRFKADPISFSWSCRTFYSPALRRLPFEPKPEGFRMTELEVRNITIHWSIEVGQLNNLTKFVNTETNLTVADLCTLLEKSPNIQTLEVATNSRSLPTRTGRLILPTLTTLILTADASILQYIEIPALQVLQFQHLKLSTALHHMSPKCPPLEALSVTKCASVRDETLPLPDSLRLLELVYVDFAVDSLVDEMVAGKCPNITHLNLTGTNLHVSPIIRLVKARNCQEDPDQVQVWLEEGEEGNGEENKSSVVKLHTINMDRCEHIEADKLPWLRAKVPIVTWTFDTKIAIRVRKRAYN